MRLIDSNALIGALHNVTFEDGTDREIVYRCVELAQTIEERKTGKWIPETVSSGRDSWTCSVCGRRARGKTKNLPYCHCGAKMEVDE